MTSSQRQAASQEAASLEQAAVATRALIGMTVALNVLLTLLRHAASCKISLWKTLLKVYDIQKVEATEMLIMLFRLTTICP